MAEKTERLSLELDQLGGIQIAGRFKLGKMLGHGGYGAVYAAEQVSVRRRCAVKVLVPHVAANPANTQRFEREARLTSQLAHPNTVVVYDFGLDETHQFLFIAMEYIAGESLRDRIRSRNTLTLATTLHITQQIAGSLQDAHERGLVHRDVKPPNVMVTSRGGDPDFVKVIDFGIAKFLDSSAATITNHNFTATGMVVGTPAYMSPEQVRDGTIDGRTDQYALAVCVYQMLTGRPVFQGESPVDIATRHLMQAPLPLRTLNPRLRVNSRFEDVLLRALEKEPDDRFPSIAQFADELVRSSKLVVPGPARVGPRSGNSGDSEAATESVSISQIRGSDVDALARTATSEVGVDPDESTARDAEREDDPPLQTTRSARVKPLPASTPVSEEILPSADDVPGGTVRLESLAPRGVLEEIVDRDRAGSTGDIAAARSPRRAVFGAAGLAIVALLGLVLVVAVTAPTQTEQPRAVATAAPSIAAKSPPTPEPKESSPKAESLPEPTLPVVAVPAIEPSKPKPEPKQRPESKSKPPPKPKPKPTVEVKKEQRIAGMSGTEAPLAKKTPEPALHKAKPGKVTVTILPWGTLFVDGRRAGDASSQELSLPPGTHNFELRQDGTARARKTVDVRSGQNTMVELIAN